MSNTDPNKLAQLMAAYKAAQAQGVPDALNPNMPTQPTPQIADLLKFQNPNAPAPASSFMDNVLSEAPQEQPEEPKKENDEYKPVPEDYMPAEEEPKKEVAPKEESEDDEEEPKSKRVDISGDIDSLKAQQANSRQRASGLNNMAIMQQAASNAVGRHADTSALHVQAQNELGKADDLQRVIGDKNMQSQLDIRQDAAEINHKQAIMQLGSAEAMSDKDSDISKAARGVMLDMAKSSGMAIDPAKLENLPYSAISTLMPNIERILSTKLRTDEMRDVAQYRAQMVQAQRQQMADKVDDAAMQKLRKEMESSNQSSRSAIGRNAQIVDSADRIKTFLAPIMKDPNKATNLDMSELARVVDGMMSNGAASITGMTKLTPVTAGGDIAKVQQYLTGNLTGTNQGEFVKRFLQVAEMEQKAAQAKIAAYHDKVLSGYPGLAARRPDDVKNLVSKFNEDAKSSVAPSNELIQVRRKADGKTKTLDATSAQKYLSDPNYEQVK